jgi:hypothetical protein
MLRQPVAHHPFLSFFFAFALGHAGGPQCVSLIWRRDWWEGALVQMRRLSDPPIFVASEIGSGTVCMGVGARRRR